MVASTLIIVVVALLFSMFFSGMEIAFVASNKLKLEIERKQSRSFNYIAAVFLKHPGQYITTMLVGNNIALVVYSMNMTLLIRAVAAACGWVSLAKGSILFETLVSTVIIIFTAEFIPKAVVKLNPNSYLRFFAVPIYLIYLLLYPIAVFSTWLSLSLLRLCGIKVRKNDRAAGFNKVDLEYLVDQVAETEEDGHRENEIKIFQNALDFSGLKVRDCMVPRIDIEAVSVDDTIEELTERFVKTQYSRIFVYEGSIDNIIGYVNTKSMFRMPATVSEVMMSVDYVPESFSAQKLLDLFIVRKSSVAVVIDEFGGTAGMVSMEDVLEEIFGEIEDEHDAQDMVEKRIGDDEYIFSCRLEIGYLNEKYGLDIPESDEYDTLAGYIIYNVEGIPEQKQVVDIDNNRITILRKSASKLEVARVERLKKNV